MFVCIISVFWNVLNVCGCIGGRGQCALFRIRISYIALCLCLELFISGGLVAFVFTKELSMFVMCGGFMT